jgi:(p)ppGpp synthase/HD superfamily hydrolase
MFQKIAEDIAREAHKDQTRWDKSIPYITHPESVAKAVKRDGVEYVAVAWLHDVLEDTSLNAVDLMSAGIPETIVTAVLSITRLHNEDYLDYILRVSKNTLARIVKVADINHNLSTLPENGSKSRTDKYKLAKYMLEEMWYNERR